MARKKCVHGRGQIVSRAPWPEKVRSRAGSGCLTRALARKKCVHGWGQIVSRAPWLEKTCFHGRGQIVGRYGGDLCIRVDRTSVAPWWPPSNAAHPDSYKPRVAAQISDAVISTCMPFAKARWPLPVDGLVQRTWARSVAKTSLAEQLGRPALEWAWLAGAHAAFSLTKLPVGSFVGRLLFVGAVRMTGRDGATLCTAWAYTEKAHGSALASAGRTRVGALVGRRVARNGRIPRNWPAGPVLRVMCVFVSPA